MIHQSFVYDPQRDEVIPRPPDDSYRRRLQQEREAAERERELRESLIHPGVYL